jgi:alpha-mannosidase
MTLDAHIVSHTHWDREWYHPLERFQQRLVALVDDLLDDPPSGDESFLLDGQAIVVDDYLEIRPERAMEIGALLRDGRLEAGPWYVLADELIPSGEALVRNLLAGRRALRRFDAASPPVLYCPDSFGHPASLPVSRRALVCR